MGARVAVRPLALDVRLLAFIRQKLYISWQQYAVTLGVCVPSLEGGAAVVNRHVSMQRCLVHVFYVFVYVWSIIFGSDVV